jgi:MerR family transcriptional regulator, light-induced transcriptional regulator
MDSGLSIGRLAEATGVAAGTLRMWEARHGFPAPARGEGRQRRYGPDDVARIRLVLSDRGRGLSLAAAIARAREWAPAAPASIFAVLRGQQPTVQPMRMPLWAMLALSRAVEDECLARAGRPVIAGSFQTEQAYRVAEPRWRELNRTAALAFVLAAFRRSRSPRGGPLEIRMAADEPMRREWSVVCVDRHYSACLAAWELPQQAEGRSFEMLWSTVPEVVTAAMRSAIALAGPRLAERAAGALAQTAAAPPPAEAASALVHRMIGYVAAGRA